MSSLNRHSSITWTVITLLFMGLIGINTYIARTTINELHALQGSIKNTGDVMVALDELQISLLKAESAHRAFIIDRSFERLSDFNQAAERVDEALLVVSELNSEISEQRNLIKKVTMEIALYLSKLKVQLQSLRQTAPEDNTQSSRELLSDYLYTEVEAVFSKMALNENRHRALLSFKLERVTAESQTTFFISLITSMLLVIGIFFLARMNIRFQKMREREIEERNAELFYAVEERTKELSLYSEELKRSNRELEDFAFVASHDLQEPLRKIQAFGERLNSSFGEALGEKGQDYLQRMHSAASRMSILISDLLEFSRVHTRGKPFENVDLNTIVDECIDDLSVKVEELNARVVVEELPVVKADALQMRQLFTNLISNALKFSRKEVAPHITISAKKGKKPQNINIPNIGNWYKIEIVDNGIGFDQEYADKIFAPFQRLHTRNEYKGTGIGLSICRRIVERHNGEISALAKLNQGATFIIIIPATNAVSQITVSDPSDERYK